MSLYESLIINNVKYAEYMAIGTTLYIRDLRVLGTRSLEESKLFMTELIVAIEMIPVITQVINE